MLQNLHVKNIALIDEAEIDFTEGLNILTGETGAGKSILIDSVNFALGARMSKDVVRDDAEYALSELLFYVEDDSTLARLKELDINIEDREVVLQRKMTGGKSVCKCNGETITAAMLKEIASYLIDIHGQHEHQSLLYKKNHIAILDKFCGDDFNDELCKLKDAYYGYIKVKKEYEEAVNAVSTRQQDIDYASFVVNEIESARLKEGEDVSLEKDYMRMNNIRKISEALNTAMMAFEGEGEGADSLVMRTAQEIKQIAALDENAGELYDQIAVIEDMMGDFSRSLHNYEESLDFSPEEMDHTEKRLDEINRLKMKYGKTIQDILDKCAEEEEKISRLNDYDNYINDLAAKQSECYNCLHSACERVSDIRKKEGKTLEKDITEALNNLNFLDARFEISITKSEECGPLGYDDVEFMISTNPGEEVRPLTLVASGGELSRIMLALKSVLAKRDSIGTLIFDEIDTGISGKTAQRVADRMSEIAKSHQVICITHLPQIASHAFSHFLIEKTVEGAHTSTYVKKLDYDASIEELSRMLAGESITDAVRENAREMKKDRQQINGVQVIE